MAKGRKLPSSRSEILLGSYGYNNQSQGTVNDCLEFGEDEVWSVEWSSRAAEESHGHQNGHAGGLSFVYDDPSATSASRIIQRGQDSVAQSTYGIRHVAASAPVNVPDWSKIYRVNSVESMQDWESEDFSDHKDSKMVPPHEYLARESARSRKLAANSVFEGAGRTLKGRDMSRVRETVWSQTGFDG